MRNNLFLKLYGIIFLSSLGLFTLVAVLLTPIVESRFVDDAISRDSAKDAAGAFFLLEKALYQRPESSWQKALEEFPADANFSVDVFKKAALAFSTKQLDSLAQNDIVVDAQITNGFVAFKELNGNWVMAITDLAVSDELETIQTQLQIAANVIAAFMFFLTTGLVLRYLQSRLEPLNNFAQQLSIGQFETKLPTKNQDNFGLMFARLNESAARLAQLIATRKSLVDGIGHDLRTPLSRIRFLLASIQDHDATLSDIKRNLDEIDTTIQTTLKFARLDQDVTMVERELDTWLQEILAPYETADLTVTLSIEPIVPPKTWQAEIQPELLQRAVVNLLENAKAHTQSEINVTLGVNDSDWFIQIDDNGPGFAPDAGPRLGLTIVSAIMQIHGGSFNKAQSPLGGARVSLRWPRKK
jgi:two-component system sensor histidine kinase RstB